MFDTKLVYIINKVTKFKDIVSRVRLRLRLRARVCAPVYPCTRVRVRPCVCVCVCARVRVHMCLQKPKKSGKTAQNRPPPLEKNSAFR